MRPAIANSSLMACSSVCGRPLVHYLPRVLPSGFVLNFSRKSSEIRRRTQVK